MEAPGVPASSITSPLERYLRESAGKPARKTCLPPSLDDSLPQDAPTELKGGRESGGVSGIRHSAGQAHVAAVPLTSTEGGTGLPEELPCRERGVGTGEGVCAERNPNPASVQHSSDSIPSLLPWPFDPTGQGDDKPLTPGRFWIPVSELEPMPKCRALSGQPMFWRSSSSSLPGMGWFGCACSHAHQATPLSRPEPAWLLLSPSRRPLRAYPVGVSDCHDGSRLASLASGQSGCWF